MATLYLSPQGRQRLEDLLARHLPNVSAWAYGSRVNGDVHNLARLPAAFQQELLHNHIVLRQGNSPTQ